MKIIEELQIKNPDLRQAEIEGLIHLIIQPTTTCIKDLIHLTGLPDTTIRSFVRSLSGLKLNAVSGLFDKSPEFLSWVSKISFREHSWKLLSYSDLELEERLKTARSEHNIKAKRELDQFFADNRSSVAKAMILHRCGMVKQRRVLLLGDDDLVSVVLTFHNSEYERLVVADTDKDLLDKIKTITQGKAETLHYDVRKPLPRGFESMFDVVIVDPPYTRSGVSLFLDRAVQFLRLPSKQNSRPESRIFFYYGNSFKSPEKFLKVQEVLNKLQLVVENKIDKFSFYDGAESIGSSSSLYILKPTVFTKPGLDLAGSKIYTHETVKEEKFPYVDHIVFKLFGVNPKLMTNKTTLLQELGEFCKIHSFKIVDTRVTPFPGKGFTINFVLSNSNLSVHTWPEYKALHLDLVTCEPIHKKGDLISTLTKIFLTEKIDVISVE